MVNVQSKPLQRFEVNLEYLSDTIETGTPCTLSENRFPEGFKASMKGFKKE